MLKNIDNQKTISYIQAAGGLKKNINNRAILLGPLGNALVPFGVWMILITWSIIIFLFIASFLLATLVLSAVGIALCYLGKYNWILYKKQKEIQKNCPAFSWIIADVYHDPGINQINQYWQFSVKVFIENNEQIFISDVYWENIFPYIKIGDPINIFIDTTNISLYQIDISFLPEQIKTKTWPKENWALSK